MTLTWIYAGLIAMVPPLDQSPSPPPADVTQAYQEARSKAGRSSEEQVKLALWCEAHGLTAERLNHLTLAILADPRNAAARGLMGLVAHDGRWSRPDAVAEKAKADAEMANRLADYNGRRDKTPDTADAQWKLALWCEENELKPEAQAHLMAVVRLDPSREAAWKRLGCRKYEGHWLNEAAIAAEKADDEAQKAADKKWKPLLAQYREALRGKDEAKREEAEKALDALTDPRATRWVCVTFASQGAWGQAMAIRLLGQIDSAPASRALALLAVFGETSEIRRSATETIKFRDRREYAGLLIGLLRDLIKYEVRPVNGPGSPGVLFVEGQQYNVQRMYSPPPVPPNMLNALVWANGRDAFGLPTDVFQGFTYYTHTSKTESAYLPMSQFMHYQPTDPALAGMVHQAQVQMPHTAQWRAMTNFHANATPADILFNHNPKGKYGVNIAKTQQFDTPHQDQYTVPIGQMVLEYQKSAAVAQQQLTNDVASLDRQNASVKASNDLVTQALRSVSGCDLGDNREGWKAWYVNLKGYAYRPTPEQPKPTFVEDVPLAYQPQSVGISQKATNTGPTVASPVAYHLGSTSPVGPDCFAAGTLVRTFTGPRPIETLRAGDRVLTQNTSTGALGYKPVINVHHNPPSPTFEIHVAGDTIVSNAFHRFWKSGQGWVTARDLKAGDRLRLLDGVSEVTGVDEGKVQLVYNLDIAEDADFFAGRAAVLVHDNTLFDPRLVPFDAAQPSPSTAPKAK